MLARLGELMRSQARLEAYMADELANARRQFEPTLKQMREEAETVAAALEAWAEANKAELTDGGRVKRVELASGVIAWRKGKPRVALDDEEGVIVEALKALGLTAFVRIKETVDKQALLKAPERAADIPGVRIEEGGEDIILEPHHAEAA